MRYAGKIKFYYPPGPQRETGGWGIIKPDDGSEDVFLHNAILERCGFAEPPEPGMNVEYEFFQSRKGRRCSWIR